MHHFLTSIDPRHVGALALLIAVVLLIFYLRRLGESSLKRKGFVPLEVIDEELRELVETYLNKKPVLVYVQNRWASNESGSTYYMKLESINDEGQPRCIVIRMATAFRNRVVVYRFYGSRWLFRIMKKMLFRLEYSHLKKIPLTELKEFNEQYLDRYGLFAFGDEDFDLQDPSFQRILQALCIADNKRPFIVGLLGSYILISSDSQKSVMNLWERLKPIL